tara:strand:- start:1533 stop:1784 length:252 start_codon:yes stop_codon:yes gene_type:complete
MAAKNKTSTITQVKSIITKEFAEDESSPDPWAKLRTESEENHTLKPVAFVRLLNFILSILALKPLRLWTYLKTMQSYYKEIYF